ncbi:GDSL esterase/lipase [Spatholobus suberectus]|nr:GDSL esterase/lipase [Spatholobus suberectus]
MHIWRVSTFHTPQPVNLYFAGCHIPLWKEVEYKDYQKKLRAYLGDENANEIMMLVSIGKNDFLENYYLLPPEGMCQFTNVQQHEDFLIGLVENIFKEADSTVK